VNDSNDGRRPDAAADGRASPPDRRSAGGAAGLAFLPAERRAVGALAAIYATRMLGLFLLLPVLALYAAELPGATAALAGLAVGAYGLTQALLQIPFGVASDRFGRRPVITAGLVLYALGSVLGALAGSVWAVIVARMVQGAGAVSAPVTALLADLTRDTIRTRAMALIGISIAGSFLLSLVGAPALSAKIGVPGLFWVMAALAVGALVLLWTVVPATPDAPHATAPTGATAATAGRTAAPQQAAVPPRPSRVAGAWNRTLRPYYFGMFVLHFVLTATFVGVPNALQEQLGVALAEHWKTYLGVFVLSLAGTVPLVFWTERSRHPDGVMRYGIALLLFAQGALAFAYGSYWGLACALVGFFAAFNFLEARLPARLSQAAGPAARGAALGLFATAQFLGAFAGGAAGGLLHGSALGLEGVFGVSALGALAWLLVYRPKPPDPARTRE